MNVFIVVVNVVLVAATLVVIWYARATVKEGHKATDAARETVDKSAEIVSGIADLLKVAEATAAASAEAAASAGQTVAAAQDLVVAARETIEVARAAHVADERDRKVRQLRDVGALAETLFWKAAHESGYQSRTGGWRVMEHNYLQQALVGLEGELPKCVELTQANLAESAMGIASQARYEVEQALKKLSGPA